MNRGGSKGFTLIELLVTVLIAGVLLSALFVMYQRGLVFWRVQADILETRDQLRIGLDRAAREVRAAVAIEKCAPSGGDHITFQSVHKKRVRYYYDAPGGQLLRMVDGGANGVADRVDGFEASYRPEGLVTLRLTGGSMEGKPVSLETTVWVRTAGD